MDLVISLFLTYTKSLRRSFSAMTSENAATCIAKAHKRSGGMAGWARAWADGQNTFCSAISRMRSIRTSFPRQGNCRENVRINSRKGQKMGGGARLSERGREEGQLLNWIEKGSIFNAPVNLKEKSSTIKFAVWNLGL